MACSAAHNLGTINLADVSAIFSIGFSLGLAYSILNEFFGFVTIRTHKRVLILMQRLRDDPTRERRRLFNKLLQNRVKMKLIQSKMAQTQTYLSVLSLFSVVYNIILIILSSVFQLNVSQLTLIVVIIFSMLPVFLAIIDNVIWYRRSRAVRKELRQIERELGR
jgi:ABC-type multidrug transport system fused ATPase/permease subunit